jgi:hypothetical protein
MRNFKNLFIEAYTANESTSARRIVVYGLLHNLFQEFSLRRLTRERKEDYHRYGLQCKHNLEEAISELSLFIPANYENILALLLAVSIPYPFTHRFLSYSSLAMRLKYAALLSAGQ